MSIYLNSNTFGDHLNCIKKLKIIFSIKYFQVLLENYKNYHINTFSKLV